MSLEPLLAAAAKRPGVEVTDDTLPNGLPWPPTYDSIRFGASVPDTWICVDCGWNTAPRMGTAQQMLEAFNARHGVEQTVGWQG